MRSLRVLAVAVVLVAISSFSLLPPNPRSLPPASAGTAPVRGVVHVHTRRSDGTGTVDQIAEAAARAGLSFVILTDHGDAAREPDRPVYRAGVLCIDAVEISTSGGHVVALGLPKSPYPLGGEARDVVEDIARLGGMSIAAHPTSSRAALRWHDWSVPIDGIEWLNGDSEWRDERLASLGRAVLTYPVRRAPTLVALLDRPEESLRHWDELTRTRAVVSIAASDAHARIGVRAEGDPFEPRIALHLPSYEQVFRSFSISLPGLTLTRDPTVDAKAVVDAIRRGRVFSSIDGLASPAIVSFHAERGGVTAHAGDTMPTGSRVDFHVNSNAPDDARVMLLRDGQVVADGPGSRLEYSSADPGAYRVEIRLLDSPGDPATPWVVTNPIYVRENAEPSSQKSSPVTYTSRYQDGPADGWTIEKSASSQGAVNVVPTIGGTQVSWRFALGAAEDESPFVGLVVPAGSLAGHDRIVFTAAANRPLRVSLQVRAPGSGGGERWQRSIYLDETARAVVVRLDDMTPAGSTTSARPPIDRVRDVMFVIDTVNARGNANGQIWIDDVKYGR